MGRLPLHLFLPIKTQITVLRLVDYIFSLKERERYSISDCLNNIPDTELKILFCKKLIEKGLDVSREYEVSHWLNEESRINSKREEEKKARERKRQKDLANQKRIEEKNRVAREKLLRKKKKHESKKLKPSAINKSLSNVSDCSEAKPSEPTNYSRIIASDINASELIVKKGIIKFRDYHLASVRIGNDIPKEILQQISHKFTLKRDYPDKKRKNNRFIFEPPTDLSLLLEEASKLNKFQKNHSPNQRFPQDGSFALPWENVIFKDGKMYLTHPNPSKWATFNPFVYKNHHIHSSFSDIMGYIKRKCAKFNVTAKDGAIIGLSNFQEFSKMIPHLMEYSTFENYEIKSGVNSLKAGTSFSLNDFKSSKLINKSPYIALLCKHHSQAYKIYYLLENVVHQSSENTNDEFGYLFTYNETKAHDVMIYENISDESRSSLVFYTTKGFSNQALNAISNFLSSDIENKRQKLAYGELRLKDESIILVKRISHTNLNEWRSRILFAIKGY